MSAYNEIILKIVPAQVNARMRHLSLSEAFREEFRCSELPENFCYFK